MAQAGGAACRRADCRDQSINLAIREEVFAGLAAGTRDATIVTLSGVKDNLTLREEAAGERSGHAADMASQDDLFGTAG